MAPFPTPSGPVPHRTGRVPRPYGGLYFEATGAGPALVFAHGLGGNHLSWWNQVGRFAATHTCVTFSHQGFFPSDAPPGGPDPAMYADDLSALLAHLGLAAPVLVCQSMGGWTGLSHALAHPGGLRGLVLSATSGPVDPRRSGPEGEAALAAWTRRAGPAREAGAAIGVHQAAGRRMAEEQPARHLLYRAIDAMSAGLEKEALRARMTAARNLPASVLEGVSVPTLWITGEEDVVFPSPVAPHLAARMPRARHVEIPNAGHSAYFERPEAFDAALAGFLAELGDRVPD